LLERVSPSAWDQLLRGDGDDRREFLRAIDAVKKRTQRGHKWATYLDVEADRQELRQHQAAEDRQALQEAAEQVLSFRQNRILQMAMEGWSVQEIATQLKLPSERVSDEKYKAVRKLRERLSA
jgi:RNA polymerase sigma factor (sigma-70 family)